MRNDSFHVVYQVRAFSAGDVPHVPYEDVGGLRAVPFRELVGELLPLEFELPLDSAHFPRLFAEGKSRQDGRDDSEQGKYRGSYCVISPERSLDMGEAYRRGESGGPFRRCGPCRAGAQAQSPVAARSRRRT